MKSMLKQSNDLNVSAAKITRLKNTTPSTVDFYEGVKGLNEGDCR